MGFLNWERNKDYYHKLIKEGNEQYDKPEGHTSADLDYKLLKDSALFKEQQMKTHLPSPRIKPLAPLPNGMAALPKKWPNSPTSFPY